MANIKVDRVDTLNSFREKTNELSDAVGDQSALATTATDTISAINEHESDLGNMVLTGLTASNVSAALRELRVDVGDQSALATTASDTVSAINEHESDLGTMSLNTTADNITAAINEHESDLGTMALNTTANNITAAINELDSGKVNLTSEVNQTFDTDFTIIPGREQTVAGTLRITGALIVEAGGGSGALNITDTYLSLGDDGADDPLTGGIRLLRGDGGTGSQLGNVELVWDETAVAASPAKAWKLLGMDDDGDISSPTSIVTYYNAKQLISSNVESGINVSWDSTNNNFDFNVNDFTIALGGDLSGSVDIENLDSVILDATIGMNSVALGTNTTGDYVAGVSGTSNQISVTDSGGEGSDITVALVSNPIVSGITAGDISVGLTDNNEISTTAGDLNLNSTSGLTKIKDNVTVTGNAIINGNLTVSGTTTTVNTETVTIADNIIVLNSNESGSPSQSSGFAVERGSSDNVSLLWNESSDRFEITDNDGTHKIIRAGTDRIIRFTDGDGTTHTLDTNDTMTLSEGGGIDVNFIDTSEPSFNIRIANNDRGSSQDIFKRVIVENQAGAYLGTATADSNNDVLYIRAGGGITTGISPSSDKITIAHEATSTDPATGTTMSSNNSSSSSRTFIQDISFTYDTYGHVIESSVSTGESLRVYDASGSTLF